MVNVLVLVMILVLILVFVMVMTMILVVVMHRAVPHNHQLTEHHGKFGSVDDVEVNVVNVEDDSHLLGVVGGWWSNRLVRKRSQGQPQATTTS